MTHAAGAPVDGAAETKARILEAATEEFVEHGYAGARVDRIAAAANANKQLIYRYFGNKHALYEAVFTRLAGRTRGDSGSDLERGKAVVDAMLGLDESREHVTNSMVRFLAWEGLSDQVTGDELNELRRANYEFAIGWIRSQQEAGAMRADVRPEHLAALVVATGGLPYSMPRVFEFLVGEEVTPQVRSEWRDFVQRMLQSA